METIHSLKMSPLFPTMLGSIFRDDIIDDNIVISEIKARSKPKDSALVFQTDGSLHQAEDLSELNEFVLNGVREYLRVFEYQVKDDDLYIASCWGNVSKGNSTIHGTHHHANSLVSAVYYASAPDGSARLVLEHPNTMVNCLDPYFETANSFNSTTYRAEAKQGRCYIFKSSTRHYTTANNLKNNDERISIGYTFNLKRLGSITDLGNYE
jgi:uncharacterized protein (TIGR02466 family)